MTVVDRSRLPMRRMRLFLGAAVAVAAALSISVVPASADTVTATVPVGTNPTGVAITPNGNHAYITNGGSDTV
ncbi:hypothetical protein QM646_14350, partial [Rhodococcus erythropolis]|nr:hypothetical protein [Rhodococcus erythropolis]